MRQLILGFFIVAFGHGVQAADIYGLIPDRDSKLPAAVQIKIDEAARLCHDRDARGGALFFGVVEETITRLANGTSVYRVEYYVVGMSYPTYVIELSLAPQSRDLVPVTSECPFGYK